MRRAGGWILGLLAVAAMAVGGWVALRPLFTRDTVVIGYFRAPDGRGPSNDAMFSGAAFAVAEAGNRAGRFRIKLVDVRPIDSKLPPVWIGTSEALAQYGDYQPAPFKIATMDTHPRNVDGQLRILGGCHRQGKAAAEWALASGAKRPFLLRDTRSPRSAAVADQFQSLLPNAPLDEVDPLAKPAERADLVRRVLVADPDLIFYSGEEAPYGTAEALFAEFRAKGYPGMLFMGEADPEVSFLALPCRVPEGTLLISPIGPPSAAFAATYEPATGRHAGPHGWIGYLAMKRALEIIGESDAGTAAAFLSAALRLTPGELPCALYAVRSGKFEFVQALK